MSGYECVERIFRVSVNQKAPAEESQNGVHIHSHSVAVEQYLLLMRHLPMVIGASFITYCIVVYWLYQRTGNTELLVLLTFTFVLTLFRLSSYLRHRKHPATKENVVYRKRLMAFYAFASGSLWGYLSLITITKDDTATSLIVIMVLTGLVASATASLSHIPWLFGLFVVPTMMPAAIKYLTFDDQSYVWVCVMMTVYLIVSYRFSSGIRDSALRGINLRFENIDLVEELTVEKNRAEAALREAEQSNLAKSRFLAAASHDLRQPLNSLRLFATTLKSSVVEKQHQELARNIDRSVTALQGLFDALLDISRLDSETMSVARRSFNLQSLLSQVCSGFRVQARHKHIDLTLSCPDVCVYTDPVLLENVLNNIISNAIRYTSVGTVTVSVQLVGTEKVSVEVRDSGCGIPLEKQDLVFNEFVQLDNPERDRAKGLGLGLSIVRRVTDLLEIPMQLQSDPAWGSSVSFLLERGVEANPQQSSRSSDGGGIRLDSLFVCFIDDEEDARLAMKLLLESWGCVVLVASSADECESLLKGYEYDPDVVIADYRLRDRQTGADAIRRVHSLIGRPIPAMIITGDVEPERLTEISAAGWPVMHKPADTGRLRTFLESCQSQVVQSG